MKIKIDVEIKPFDVPRRVYTADNQEFEIEKLDPRELDIMCNEFRKTIFERAGKKDIRV